MNRVIKTGIFISSLFYLLIIEMLSILLCVFSESLSVSPTQRTSSVAYTRCFLIMFRNFFCTSKCSSVQTLLFVVLSLLVPTACGSINLEVRKLAGMRD